jgi:glycerate kinase
MVEYMDKWLSHFADLCSEKLGESFKDYPGAGAAGGLGFAFLTFLDGKLRPGIELVIEATSLEEKIKNADIVITGEGRLDGQSCMGKAPIGVARLAKKHGKTVIAFSGCVTDDARLTNEHGIDAFFPIVRRPCTLVDAMNEDTAYKNLADTAEQVFRIIKIMKI